MSLAKVNTVQRAMKDPGSCESCRTPLKKGEAYRWFKVGFRSRVKRVRCMAPTCTPRLSELESSKLADVYSAQEDAEDAIDGAGTFEEIRQAISDLADAVRDVASEYDSAAVDGNGTEWNLDAAERRDTLEGVADELDNFDIDLDDEDLKCEECEGEGEVDCETCEGTGSIDEDDDGNKGVDCGDCRATGKVGCSDCDGTGELSEEDKDAKIEEAKEAAREAINGMEF